MTASTTSALRAGTGTAPRCAQPRGPAGPAWRSDSIELGPYPEAVSLARARTRELLREWGGHWEQGELADDAEMIVSELVTNALEATRKERLDSPIRLTLIAGPGSLLIAVWDAADSAPAPREADGDALSGRGLLIVEALSAQWDCKPGPADRGGKTVRALLGPSGWGRTNAS